ncbi:ATP-grasp domain-containing protein [Pectobacterium polaris]|uniref:ATP-grasp domain-containing protein n=1 Tax=Pectobacterium polaris TaxID=2042057 RepID=UPI001F2314A4|nr:ATP-grasp domain-containing protein [Pectobacterium polaris]
MKYIVFIESNTTGTGEIFLKKASEEGFEPVLLYKDKKRYPFLSSLPFKAFETDTTDINNIGQFICEKLGRENVAGVWSTSEYFITTASEIAARLNLPSLNFEAINKVRSKKYQRELLNKNSLCFTPYTLVENENDVIAFASNVGFPVIIKPTDKSGSIGVRAINNDNELLSTLRSVLNGADDSGEWIVEKYYSGEQYSVEIFNSKVIGITHQHYSHFPKMIAVGHDFPALLSEETTRLIENTMAEVISLFSLTAGPVHIELRILKDGIIKIIEINPRLAGGFIPEILRLSTGADLIKACLDFCTANKINIEKQTDNYAAIRFLVKGCQINENQMTLLKEKAEILLLHHDEKKFRDDVIYGDFRDRYGHVMIMSPDPSIRTEINQILNGLTH